MKPEKPPEDPARVRTSFLGEPAPEPGVAELSTANGGARKLVFASTVAVNSNAPTPVGMMNAHGCNALVAPLASGPA